MHIYSQNVLKSSYKMKKFLLILTCALGALCTVKAQTYAAIPDTIWGCRYFSQNLATDFPYSSG